ncbi:MAG: hypothetical protein HQL55_10775 [Magnetococcales bacterium]|nr:hypothetical protein [Magnetococcales bacterium]
MATIRGEETLSQLAIRFSVHPAMINHWRRQLEHGNKRVVYVVCLLLLRLNVKQLMASGEEKYRTFLFLAHGTLGEEALAVWI